MGWHLRPLLTVTFAAFAADARAYPTPVDFDGSLMRWDIGIEDAPITYELNADLESFQADYGDIADVAASMWSAIPNSYFRYAPVATGETAQVTINLKSTIDGGDYSAGYAIFDEYDGIKPVHCLINVVVDDYVSYSGMQKTILHELGHCAGLGHTLIPQAIMSYRLEENSFALDIDDKAAVARLYPADGSKPHLPRGCAVGAVRGGDRWQGLWLLLLLVLPVLWPAVGTTLSRRRAPKAHHLRANYQPIANIRSIARFALARISGGTSTS